MLQYCIDHTFVNYTPNSRPARNVENGLLHKSSHFCILKKAFKSFSMSAKCHHLEHKQCKIMESIAASFMLPVEPVTEKHLLYVIISDIDGIRTRTR